MQIDIELVVGRLRGRRETAGPIPRTVLAVLAVCVFWSSVALAQANGKLQIHHIDVGQGDGAVLVSPGGQVVLFDVGEDMQRKDCTRPVSYLDQLGVKHVDFLFVSHYHFDHIGCIPAVLSHFSLIGKAYDRGGNYQSVQYNDYDKATKGRRVTANVGDVITLDKASATPVTISVIAVDGKSQESDVSTKNENDLSLAVVVSYGNFREEIGGDLSGENANSYQDVETPVAPEVGHVDVYKVHHHCSSYSSNDAWLAAITPTVGIVSTGDGNGYKHPAADCLARLHANGLKKLYWTEGGNGGSPQPPIDVVSGNIVVEVPAGGATYTVTGDKSGTTDSYQSRSPALSQSGGGGGQPPPTPTPAGTTKYAWSSKSQIYHMANCSYVANISKGNLQTGDTPPGGKRLHKACSIIGQ
jgi:beta-lactamase superfamily II metal-dependent hydrolase